MLNVNVAMRVEHSVWIQWMRLLNVSVFLEKMIFKNLCSIDQRIALFRNSNITESPQIIKYLLFFNVS